ncbi:MAG: hypothetical protein WC539_03365 [Nitrospirota bacterium]
MNNRHIFLIIVVLIPFLLCNCASFPAEKIELKEVKLPDRHYNITTSTSMNITMRLKTPSLATEDIRKNFPVSMHNTETKIMKVKTGSIAENNSFPLTFELIKHESITSLNNGPVQRIPKSKFVGLRIHGASDYDGNENFFEIESTELSREEKKQFTSLLEQLSKQGKVQKKSISVGESFTEKTPINMPLLGINFAMEMTVTYTLLRIKHGMAYFDYIGNLKLDISAEPVPVGIQASGDYAGKLSYDITKKAKIKDEGTITMKGEMPLGDQALLFSGKLTQTSITEIQ